MYFLSYVMPISADNLLEEIIFLFFFRVKRSVQWRKHCHPVGKSASLKKELDTLLITIPALLHSKTRGQARPKGRKAPMACPGPTRDHSDGNLVSLDTCVKAMLCQVILK